jgi:RNA-splicing ligase RtcB
LWTAKSARFSSIAKAQLAPSAPAMKACRPPFAQVGQPVLIGGSMGTGSYILAGAAAAEQRAFSSACHGAGRATSRHAALKQWSGRAIQDDLAAQGILVRRAASPRRRLEPTRMWAPS